MSGATKKNNTRPQNIYKNSAKVSLEVLYKEEISFFNPFLNYQCQ